MRKLGGVLQGDGTGTPMGIGTDGLGGKARDPTATCGTSKAQHLHQHPQPL